MMVTTTVPPTSVRIVLDEVTADDVRALINVLDTDRNHPARRALYAELRRAELLMSGQPVVLAPLTRDAG